MRKFEVASNATGLGSLPGTEAPPFLSFKAATTKADTKPKVFDPTEAKPTTTAMSGKLSFGQPTVMSEKFSFGQMKDEKLADDSEEKEDVRFFLHFLHQRLCYSRINVDQFFVFCKRNTDSYKNFQFINFIASF